MGLGNIIAMPWAESDDKDTQALLGFGLVLNGLVFVLPGIVAAGIGSGMRNRAKRERKLDAAVAARVDSETPEARLRRVDLLRSTGAITEAEHQAQRMQIVKSL